MDIKFWDGKLSEPNDEYTDIDIPSYLLITNFDDPIQAIVQSTYPNIVKYYKDPIFFTVQSYFCWNTRDC